MSCFALHLISSQRTYMHAYVPHFPAYRTRSCFTSCFYIDSVVVIEQTLLGDHDPDFDFISDRRDLAEEDEAEAGEDFARTLEAALSDDSFSDDDHRRLDPGHVHRRRRNRVKTKANGRCRSACRTPIKARDRRLHELEENQRMVDVSNDGQIANYYRALDEHDDYYQPTHRRLFCCEELLQEELEDMARSYRGTGQSAFNCLSSVYRRPPTGTSASTRLTPTVAAAVLAPFRATRAKEVERAVTTASVNRDRTAPARARVVTRTTRTELRTTITTMPIPRAAREEATTTETTTEQATTAVGTTHPRVARVAFRSYM